MADLTAKIAPSPVAYALHGFGDTVVYRANLAELDALAVGTHTLVNLPVGTVPLGGYLLVTKAAASSGAATVAFAVGGATLVSAVGKANLGAGVVIPVNPTVTGTTSGAMSGSTPTPVTLTVAGAALTEFEFLLAVKSVDLAAAITKG